LEELAPASILSEMREPEKKTERRQKALQDLYRVARMEQDYQIGAIGKYSLSSTLSRSCR